MKKFLTKAARFVFYLAGSAVILTPTVHAYVDPATTSYVVQIIAGIVIACGTGIGIFWNRMRRKVKKKKEDAKSVKYGVLLGVIFCVASNIQQHAFAYTSAGKIAFITALYIFFVPLLGLFVKKRTPLLTWLCVLMGFAGLYFLCVDPKDMGEFNKGDLLAIGCAAVFALHILTIERFTAKGDGLRLSAMQFLVGGALSGIAMFIFETPKLSGILDAAIPLLYAGIMSCGVAYTLQIIGQKYTEATVASLILCMESVFGVLTAAVILGERLSVREIIGCVIMFGAIILSQFSQRLSKANKKTA